MNALLSQNDLLPLAFGAGMFVAALMLLIMLSFALANDQKRIRRRLARIGMGPAVAQAGANMPSLRRNTTDSSIAGFDRLLKQLIPHPAKFRARLAATGWRISIGEYVLACLLVGGMSFGARLLYSSLPLWIAALVGVSSAIWLPHNFVSFMIKRRRNRFIMLLPEAIDLIVRGLRSGLPITESMKVVGQEIPDPVGIEFRRIIESFSIGLTLEEALWAAAERIGRTPMTIRRMIRRKLLQAVLVGNTVMVLERSVENYLRPRPYAPQKPAPVCAGWNDKLRDELRPTKAQEIQP